MQLSYVNGLDGRSNLTISCCDVKNTKAEIVEDANGGWIRLTIGELEINLFPDRRVLPSAFDYATVLSHAIWVSRMAHVTKNVPPDGPELEGELEEHGGIVLSGYTEPDYKPKFDITQDPDAHPVDVTGSETVKKNSIQKGANSTRKA